MKKVTIQGGFASLAFLIATACSSAKKTEPPANVPHDLKPVSSDLAINTNGGGCYPTDVTERALAQIVLVNPEWAPVIRGSKIDADPVLAHGTVVWSHGDTGGDYPATHVRSDANAAIKLDPDDVWLLASGNVEGEEGTLELEWEAGAFPDWAWPSAGDRVVALGRWIFDCGHPGTRPRKCTKTAQQTCSVDQDCRAPACPSCGSDEICDREHYGYQSELHPPYAAATIRKGRGAIISSDPAAGPVPATRADVYVSPFGGAAGDRCILSHQQDTTDLIFNTECFPLHEPVAKINATDFKFDVPLPRRPGSARAAWRIDTKEAYGGIPAGVAVTPHEGDPDPHLEVRVKLTERTPGGMPTGFSATIYAGWEQPPADLTHVRVTMNALRVINGLHAVPPVVRDVKLWRLQAGVNGEWREIQHLESVDSGDRIEQAIVWDHYLPPDGSIRIEANGSAAACIDTLFGKSLATSIRELGLNEGVRCLLTSARNPGVLDVSYEGPDFGAGPGSHSYVAMGLSEEGSRCEESNRTCTSDRQCSGKRCIPMEGAFALEYTIERLPR